MIAESRLEEHVVHEIGRVTGGEPKLLKHDPPFGFDQLVIEIAGDSRGDEDAERGCRVRGRNPGVQDGELVANPAVMALASPPTPRSRRRRPLVPPGRDRLHDDMLEQMRRAGTGSMP